MQMILTKFIDVKSFDPDKMMSVFMKRIVKEEVLQRQNSPREDLLKNKEKVGKYAKLIKDMHPPKVSKVKKKEMLALKEAVSNPRLFNKKPRISDIKTKLNKSGNGDGNTLDKLDFGNSESASPNRVRTSVASHKVPKSHIVWNFVNNMLPKPEEKREPVVVDYLKIKREERSNGFNGKSKTNT